MNNRAQQRFDRSLKESSLIDKLHLYARQAPEDVEATKRRAMAEKVLPVAEAALASGMLKGVKMDREQIANCKHVIKTMRKVLEG